MDPKIVKKEVREDLNVKLARNRFKNVLKHMVQDNFMQEETSDSDTEENRIGGQGYNRLSFRYPAPKKRAKSDSFTDPPKQQQSFMMKLFDRGVDLAQFDDNTPLYPICRAWMQNKANVNVRRKDDDNDSEASNDYHGETDDFYRLPPPDILPYDEYGNQMCIRVPPPLDRTDEEFDINYSDESAPSPALLFQNHLDRWNLIRQRWREAGAYNEQRYQGSFAVLRQIHDKVNVAPPSS